MQLIDIEGLDGSGKTTVSKLVVKKLQYLGYNAVYVREPGGSEIAEKIRDLILKDDKMNELDVAAEVLLFSAARIQLHSDVIDKLPDDTIVVYDRYIGTTECIQCYNGGFSVEKLAKLCDVMEIIKPDISILIDIPVELGLERIAANSRETNRNDKRPYEWHQKNYDAYRHIFNVNPYGLLGKAYRVSGDDTVENVADNIIKIIAMQK